MADLTSTASIRAVLGVSEKEIRDTVLTDPTYSTLLYEALYAIDDNIITQFTAAEAASPRSDLEERFVNLMQTFSAYHIALQCCTSIPMFAPITIKDSRSELTRSDDPYKNLRVDITATLGFLKKAISKVLGQLDPAYSVPTSVDRILAVSTGLATDPVTG